MNQTEINEVLSQHELWLSGTGKGKRGNFCNKDLSNVDFSNTDLSHIVLTNTNLTGAKFVGARFVGSYLSGANLSHADFSHAILNYVNIFDVNLTHTNLSYVDLTRVYFSNAHIIKVFRHSPAHFIHVDLSSANLSNATITFDQFQYIIRNFKDVNLRNIKVQL